MTPEITPQMTSRTTALAQLYAAALQSDAQADWQAVWQALAGTRLVVPLEDGDGDTVRPRLVAIDGQRAVQGFESMDLFARLLDAPGEYAEVDGAELCEMLAAQDTGLAVSLEHYDAPLLVGREAVQWIAMTFRAEVSRGMNDGVSVVTPDLPSPELVALMGQTVGALGADCPEAWLVDMVGRDGDGETVLVLGLTDAVRPMEADIAETVTRAIQAGADRPVAVACPDRGSALMDQARRKGIGIGG